MFSQRPPTWQRVFQAVTESDNLAADAALAVALPTLRPPHQQQALDAIVARRRANGLARLVANFNGYDDGLQALVVARIDQLFEGVRSAANAESVDARLSAVELIRRSGDTRLAYLLGDAMARRCPRTQNAAAAALQELTRGWAGDRTSSPRSRRRAAANIVQALRRAMDCWALHHRSEIVVAALWLCEEDEDIVLPRAETPRASLAHVIDEAFRGACGPAMAPYAWRALPHKQLRDSAIAMIETCTDPEFVTRLLDAAWVTADPDIARCCARVRAIPWLGDRSATPKMTDRQATAAVRVLMLSGIAQEEKARMYRRLIVSHTGALREAAFWCAVDHETVHTTELLRRLSGAHDPRFARVAAHELFRRDPAVRKRVLTGADAERSGTAVEDDLDVFWDRLDLQTDDERAQSARLVQAKRPHEFAALLRRKLAAPDPADRLTAVSLVRSLELAADYEQRVYALSHDLDDRVRSVAVTALSNLEGATAVRILRQALHDPEPRVQANAVEVLHALDATGWHTELSPKLDSEHHRVRANAVKALLGQRQRGAAVALIGMLSHESSATRLSGLWVVQRLNLTSLAQRVVQLSRDDPDERVRERAQQVLASLSFDTALQLAAQGEETP